jgi:hypothetical protein
MSFLEQELDQGEFDTKERRQKIADVFTKETGEKFDPERIQNWYRNHLSTRVNCRLEDVTVSRQTQLSCGE